MSSTRCSRPSTGRSRRHGEAAAGQDAARLPPRRCRQGRRHARPGQGAVGTGHPRRAGVQQEHPRRRPHRQGHARPARGDAAGLDRRAPVDEDGLVTLTTDYPDVVPFSTYGRDRDARRALRMAFLNRAWPAKRRPAHGAFRDPPQEHAHLLGYADWAEYDAEVKMIKHGKPRSGVHRPDRRRRAGLRGARPPGRPRPDAAGLPRRRDDRRLGPGVLRGGGPT